MEWSVSRHRISSFEKTIRILKCSLGWLGKLLEPGLDVQRKRLGLVPSPDRALLLHTAGALYHIGTATWSPLTKARSHAWGQRTLSPYKTVARANLFWPLCCDGFPFGREDNGLRLTSGTCMKVPRGTGPDINCTIPLAGRVSMRFGATSPTLGGWVNSPAWPIILGLPSLERQEEANDGARESNTTKSEGGR